MDSVLIGPVLFYFVATVFLDDFTGARGFHLI